MKKLLKEEIVRLEDLLLEIKTNFRWDVFKNLPSQKDKILYASQNLPPLGFGSSRIAFILPNLNYILKIAHNKKGFGQNEAEVDVYTNPKSRPIVTKIRDADSKYGWIVSEIAKPFETPEQFQQVAGFPFDDVLKALTTKPEFKMSQEEINANPFLSKVVSLQQENKLMPGDLMKPDSYGKTADGRLVLLDYGFTHEVFQKHYPHLKQNIQKTNKPQKANRPTNIQATNPKTINVDTNDIQTATKPQQAAIQPATAKARPQAQPSQETIPATRKPLRRGGAA